MVLLLLSPSSHNHKLYIEKFFCTLETPLKLVDAIQFALFVVKCEEIPTESACQLQL